MTPGSPVARALNHGLALLILWLVLVVIEAIVWAWQQLGSAPLAVVVVGYLLVPSHALVMLLLGFGCSLAAFRFARAEWRRTFGTPPRRRS